MVVPVAIAGVLAAAWGWADWPLQAVGVEGAGLLLVAAAAHGLYRSFDYVQRADPALSWVLVGALAAANWGGVPGADAASVRSWAGLLAGLGSAWWMLGVHRQARVGALTFRAGALAGVAWCLEPSSIGVALAAAVVLAKSRTFLLREWLLLLLGTAWIPVTASVLAWNGWCLPELPVRPLPAPSVPVRAWAAAAAGLTVAGWVAQFTQTRSAGIRRKASRFNLALLTGIPAVAAAVLAPGTPHAWRLAAIAAGFAWVWLIPQTDRLRGPARWARIGLGLVLVGVWCGGVLLGIWPA